MPIRRSEGGRGEGGKVSRPTRDEILPPPDCSSCGEGIPKLECQKSERPCGHHCNHSWSDDECCWCGAEFGEVRGGMSTERTLHTHLVEEIKRRLAKRGTHHTLLRAALEVVDLHHPCELRPGGVLILRCNECLLLHPCPTLHALAKAFPPEEKKP